MNNQKLAALIAAINSMKKIDLTRPLETGMPAWPTQARFGSVIYDSYEYGGIALHSQITMSEHTGTHIDAPAHFIPGAVTIDNVEPGALMGRAVKIDVSGFRGGQLAAEAIIDFEKKEGPILGGDIVLFRYGWDDKYAIQPGAGEYLKDWPGLSAGAAELLAGRKIRAAGCDTLSLDEFGSRDNCAHLILLGKGIPIMENICNLSKLPIFSFVIGMPLKIKNGSGSPVRLTAFTEET